MVLRPVKVLVEFVIVPVEFATVLVLSVRVIIDNLQRPRDCL